MRTLLCAVALLCFERCARRKEAPAVVRREVDVVHADAATDAAQDAGARFERIERQRARWISSALYADGAAGAAVAIRAPGWAVSAATVGRLVLRRGRATAIYDLESDRLLPARFGEPDRWQRGATRFTAFGTSPRTRLLVDVLRAEAGVPSVTDAQGASLRLQWTTLDPQTGLVVLLGARADAAIFAGAYDASAPSPTELPFALPFAPTQYNFGGGPASTLDLSRGGLVDALETGNTGVCIRLRFSRASHPVCVGWGRSLDDPTAAVASPVVYVGDYAWSDDYPWRLRNVTAGRWEPSPIPERSVCQTLKQLRFPASALITCGEENDQQGYYAWTPRGFAYWTEPSSRHARVGDGSQMRDVLAPLSTAEEGPVDFWVDLPHQRIIETEPLSELRFSNHTEPYALLQRRAADGAIELIELDTGQLTLRVLARMSDCPAPGYLAAQAQRDPLVAFGCQMQPSDLFRGRMRWSALIDRAHRMLYRLGGVAVELLPERREAIVREGAGYARVTLR